MKKFLIFVLAASVLAGCQNNPIGAKHEVRKLTLTQTQRELCDRQNAFSMDMLRVMSKADGNVFISPLSAATVCAMIANGAVGETQAEMLRTIGAADCSLSELNKHYLNLMENLPYQDETTTVRFANAMWVDEGYPIEPAFRNDVQTHYLAEVANLELSDGASADVINGWAYKHTEGMIKKVCTPEYFKENLRLVVANALCFVGKWEEEFKKSQTYEEVFHAPEGDVQVEMMHAEMEKVCVAPSTYRDYDDTGSLQQRGAAVLRMYYKGKGYCMDIVLPDRDRQLSNLLDTITCEWIDSQLRNGWHDATVAMPKFKLQNRYTLNSYMEQLGMKLVFDPDQADLSGISKESELYLALLQQDTYLEVDEEGTKAAAVTTGWAMDGGAEPSEPFVVDRPFLLFIRDVNNGIVLFAGRINNPMAD